MPRIRLAFWHDGHAPGEEIDVAEADLPALRRDGRVADVLTAEGPAAAQQPSAQPETAVSPESSPETEPAKTAAPETGRRRR